MESEHNKAVFLDRDGVINKMLYDNDRGVYSAKSMDDFKLLPGVKEGIKSFKKMGFLVIVVTNQPGLSYGYIKEKDYKEMNDFLVELGVDKVYTCKHHPDHTGVCRCRKPKPGMLMDASQELDIDLKQSYMVGDNVSDIQAGKVCKKTIYLGQKRADIMNLFSEKKVEPDAYVSSFKEVVFL